MPDAATGDPTAESLVSEPVSAAAKEPGPEPTGGGRASIRTRFASMVARVRRALVGRPAASGPEPPTTGRGHSPAIAAGLSFLWPGLGQLVLGRRAEGIVLAISALVIVILAAVQFGQGVLMFAVSLWDQSYFLAFVAGVVSLGALRVVAVGRAFMTASRGRGRRPAELVFVGVLIAAILAIHGIFVAGSWAWYETSVSIQNNDPFANAWQSATVSHAPATTPEATSTPEAQLAGVPSMAPLPTRPPNPNRITFLCIGIDTMPGRDHALTDTLMVVSIDTATEKVSMISVPRDTSGFNLYYGGQVGSSFRLNTLLNAADSPDFGSPDPPMKTLEKEIGFLVGIPVDYYALIYLDGFAKMIDAIGGVDVVNPRNIDDPSTGIVLAAGPVHLTGELAVLYVRSREGVGESDYQRAGRQQDVLMALRRKILSPAVLPSLGDLLSLASKTIATDFPLATARNYVRAVQNVASIDTCVLGPPYSYHPDPSTADGRWVSRLDMPLVMNLSVAMFGQDSRYYGVPGISAVACNEEPE